MATDTFKIGLGQSWQTATNWTGGVPTSTSDVVIPASSPPLIVISNATATTSTVTVGTGSELEVTGNSTFNDLNASAASGTFGFIDVVTADFVIGNGTFNNSSTFQLDSTTPSQSRLLIGGNVTFDGAGHINFTVSGTGGAGSNQITSQSGIATLTDVDNEIFGSGSILDINFINETTVETGVSGTLDIWGDAGGGSFNNIGLLQADEGGTLVLGNGADNANIANTGTIELNESGTGLNTKMEIAGNVAINGAGGGQIVFSGPSSANNTIVSNGNPATLTLNGGELTGVGSIGDANLTLNLKSFLVEETKVQLVVAAASTTIDGGSKMEAANGGEIFIQGPVTNSGILNVLTGGEIFLTNTVTNQGNGSIFIGPNGTLSLVGNGEINGIVQFTGSGATLSLSADHHISNSIQGTSNGDSFDLTYETFQSGLSAVWQQAGVAGTLFLEKNGTVLTTVSLEGQYTSADFTVTPDANGNTLIKDVGAAAATPATVTQEIAGLYVTLYGLAATQAGINFWTSAVSAFDPSIAAANAGSTAISAADEVPLGQQMTAGSPVVNGTTYFQTVYPSTMTDMAFVQALYQNMSAFIGTTAGDQFWLTDLQQTEASNGGNVTLAREAIVGQFVHDFFSDNLTVGAAALGVSASDYALLVAGQQTLQNKVTVAQYWATETGVPGGAILNFTHVTDPSFAAAQHVLLGITSDPSTVTVALTGINNAVAQQNLSLA